jgi:hypothetical protein
VSLRCSKEEKEAASGAQRTKGQGHAEIDAVRLRKVRADVFSRKGSVEVLRVDSSILLAAKRRRRRKKERTPAVIFAPSAPLCGYRLARFAPAIAELGRRYADAYGEDCL